MYKNQLQELAQRSCFNLPSYSSTREGPDHAPRFKATVNFNGETFESPTFCSTLRQAEHAAAEVALNTLASRGPSRALAARVLDETGVYKNLLQETAHRAGLKLPAYTTSRSGPGHVPVFSCKVELAGMSFTGECARTKKQAQKNAAMATWSALKRLAQSAPSASSSSSSSTTETRKASEEQEQVIIARFLASLHPQELQIPKQSDCQRGQERVIPVSEELTSPTPSLYPMQYQPWPYQKLCSEMAIYQMWQQEHLLHLQNTLFMLQFPPTAFPGTQTFPYVQSPVPLDAHLFVPVENQETVAARPRIAITTSGLPICNSDPPGSHPVKGKSRVIIQEINEEKMEDLSSCSPSTVPDVPEENIKLGENQIGHNIKLGENQIGHLKLSSLGGNSGPKRVQLQVQNQSGFDSSHASPHYPLRSPTPRNMGPSQYMTRPVTNRTGAPAPVSATPPVHIRSMMPVSSAPKPQPPRMRTGVLLSPNRPLPQRMNLEVVHPRFMAPAVRIRSVVPVCSAPPPRKSPTTGQERASPSRENSNDTVAEDLSTASSNLDKLRI